MTPLGLIVDYDQNLIKTFSVSIHSVREQVSSFIPDTLYYLFVDI